MSFLDKAKAAANELAAKADTALANSGLAGPGGPPGTQPPDRLLRDLGVLTWLELNGSAQPEGERERIVGALREAEQRGALGSLALQTAATAPGAVPPPPPPGAAAAANPGQSQPVQPAAPPPPPPTWAQSEER